MMAPRMRASTRAATRRDEDLLVQRAIAVLERRMFRRGQDLLCPRRLRQYLRLRLVGKCEEVFAAVFLDAQCRALAFETLFRGTVNAAPMYARVVVKRALRHNAVGVVVAHNHPSGLATPSQADIAATRQLKAALNLVDIELLDHFVIGRGEPFSIFDAQLL
ncbi:JAB domain-containing protein [Pseudomonas aeruginosa]|uniref:JAB domain-containing protein n=1 Tax=Pseudomonas aeruginosa TaxID=287 RepID=UPI0018C4994F|nr:JAB domain-containing protein [Pseudomonas aeruginosa]MBG4736711.1 JAB domain-containing protein [Pseudomonas aeruginosa]MDA3152715.1 JAB domain-containing protein [Pseudomonas aeruginosa]MDI3708562.1 JAB domain-containing protein [Pseudomonas aeruginosa]MDI3744136.1 JAB domain-containing protein [Pseudomonas aeruginosa]HCU2081467.1 JAB domain-containing protein [Pseudomonas aeruginosa]